MSGTSENTSVCANCGKGEENSIDLKTCTACKLVKYCSRDCQIAHRPQHKKECKKRAKELYDEKLFKKQPPPEEDEDCPICMIRLPMLIEARAYKSCCGKMICCGCDYAVQSRAVKEEDDVCPFCRTPPPTEEETIKQYENRMEMNDPMAIYNLGGFYDEGQFGLRQNRAKALELWHRAGELGSAAAYTNIGRAYAHGFGVEVDEKKAKHYYELAAIRGDVCARHNLGYTEACLGNMDRAVKHWMIAASCGCIESVEDSIKQNHLRGYITKDYYDNAVKAYQAFVDEIKSDQRDEAAAFSDEYKYY